MRPADGALPRFTDRYVLKTKEIVRRCGEVQATYAVFMRRPVIFAGGRPLRPLA